MPRAALDVPLRGAGRGPHLLALGWLTQGEEDGDAARAVAPHVLDAVGEGVLHDGQDAVDVHEELCAADRRRFPGHAAGTGVARLDCERGGWLRRFRGRRCPARCASGEGPSCVEGAGHGQCKRPLREAGPPLRGGGRGADGDGREALRSRRRSLAPRGRRCRTALGHADPQAHVELDLLRAAGPCEGGLQTAELKLVEHRPAHRRLALPRHSPHDAGPAALGLRERRHPAWGFPVVKQKQVRQLPLRRLQREVQVRHQQAGLVLVRRLDGVVQQPHGEDGPAQRRAGLVGDVLEGLAHALRSIAGVAFPGGGDVGLGGQDDHDRLSHEHRRAAPQRQAPDVQ
mmetsp:Transcript_3225/g.13235  ORF Transcript_3225/g.13235 Transcript_3225/m.13235 type:complete len:343 (-) Transcript_3225:1125-2153(-)